MLPVGCSFVFKSLNPINYNEEYYNHWQQWNDR
jgi:hypothetical protein